ncbi:MAG: cytochrome C oxidase subunit IV family protein [Halobacteriaceae archaeon]
MARTKLYTAIYVALFILATAQIFIEQSGFPYWIAFAGIMVVSFVKAVMVAGYYQHLRFEPRSLAYLIGAGLTAAMALTFAAAYSIT